MSENKKYFSLAIDIRESVKEGFSWKAFDKLYVPGAKAKLINDEKLRVKSEEAAKSKKICDDILDLIKDTRQKPSIIIVFDNDYNFPIYLATYIRFYKSPKFKNVPIILSSTDNNDFPELNKNFTIINRILNFNTTDGFLFKKYESLSKYHKLPELYELDSQLNKIEPQFNTDKLIVLPKDEDESRHSISNELGSFKLSKSFNLDEDNYEFPETLYLNYCSSKISYTESNYKVDLAQFDDFKKVLFIDDDAHKGWSRVLKKIFNSSAFLMSGDHKWALNYTKSTENIDLILLDLNFKGEKENSFRFIEEIYKHNPSIPIIVFSASNKLNSFRKAIRIGALSYFVKPNFDDNRSLEDIYEDFCFAIKKVKELHQSKLHYNKIRLIIDNLKKSNLNKDNDFDDFYDLVCERLMMFYGLYRKNKITNDLDQLFKSENNIEICFMILWSLFPDIINFYFEKKCIKINEKLTQENSNVEIPYEVNAYEWIEKKSKSNFASFNSISTKDNNFTIKYSYEYLKEIHKMKTFEDELSKRKSDQLYKSPNEATKIAFILKNNITDDAKRIILLKDLYELKSLRNENYLTHSNHNVPDAPNYSQSPYELLNERNQDFEDAISKTLNILYEILR